MAQQVGDLRYGRPEACATGAVPSCAPECRAQPSTGTKGVPLRGDACFPLPVQGRGRRARPALFVGAMPSCASGCGGLLVASSPFKNSLSIAAEVTRLHSRSATSSRFEPPDVGCDGSPWRAGLRRGARLCRRPAAASGWFRSAGGTEVAAIVEDDTAACRHLLTQA
jgi:hypothetical protein